MKVRNYQIIVLNSILVFLIVIMTILTKGRILRLESLQAVAFQMPLLGLLTLAQMVPMLTGGIDLSIVSNANLAGIIVALILTKLSGWYTVPLAILAGIGTALLVGALNGFLVAFVMISPIIATLGTMILIKGISLGITKGYIIAGFPKEFLFIGDGAILGIPMPFIIFLVSIFMVSLLLNKTIYGISVYMLGSNPIATEFSGVNIKSVLFRTYLLSGFLTGIASLVMIARFNAAQAAYGESYLLLTVLACVLGGVNPAGGFGKVSGLFVAIIVLQVVATGFNLLRLSSHLANALWGLILIFVITINRTITGKWI
ncbi:ABC transporter permease [Thermotoga sp. KOL6]|uniref:ABC transporter permease n=1 Tax=Thermotoga sp. KOL6 TaxID=126741 RepID=UPI000C77414B|nr:ABC transporter permease [Thermotoga sp. KOL6]PLV59762.1 sugar ABC transporter permease [Thermotoga sp. KOL6]